MIFLISLGNYKMPIWFSQMQNLGQLSPENCRAYVFFAWCFFFFFFFFFFVSFFFPLYFFLLIAWSKICTYIPYCEISVSKIQNFQLLRGHIPLRHPLCVQACNWRWRFTKSSPNVEDGCTALCSFGVLAVVKCCKHFLLQCCFFFLFLYINSWLFYISLWRMKINLFTKFWGKLWTNKRNVFTWWSLFTL